MRLLILGGSGFVGRAVAEEAVRRGAHVTVFNRGHQEPPAGVTVLVGDRLAPDGLAALAGDIGWDAVVDTWSGPAEAVGRTAELLRGRAGHYGYVSSRSVYRFGAKSAPVDENAPLVDRDEPHYPGDKLRGELATEAFGGPVLLARAGLILGRYEDVGRLPWWLNRLARGGPTLAPGPRDTIVQLIDAADLAAFHLDAAASGLTGPVNVTGPAGHATIGDILEIAAEVTGGHAELHWTDPAVIEKAGISPWTDLPLWLPPPLLADFGLFDVSRALAAGLRCRPVRDTITATWSWLQSLPGAPAQRADRPPVGLDPAVEEQVLRAEL